MANFIYFISFIFILGLIIAAAFNFIYNRYFLERKELTDDEHIEDTVQVGKGAFVHGSEAEDFAKQPRRMRKHLEKEFQKKIKKGIIVAVPDGNGGVLGYIPRAEAKEKGLIK